MTEFANLFSALDDPRASNARRHSLHSILVIAFCTMLCGGQTCTGHGIIRPRQTRTPPILPQAGQRHPQTR